MRFTKFICILPFLLIASGLSSHQPKQDTVPKHIVVTAQKKTDKQIDSIYQNALVSPVVDALKYNFRELRSYIDTLNVRQMVLAEQNEALAFKRDSLLHAKLDVDIKNQRLIIENREQAEEINLMTKMPILLWITGCVVVGSLIAYGLIDGLKKIIRDNEIRNEL